jgi:hypothetical protein
MPAAYFVVRAIVADASKRAAFDTWYETEHVPDAVKAFGVSKAWRFWSLDGPSLHRPCMSSMTRPRWRRC